MKELQQVASPEVASLRDHGLKGAGRGPKQTALPWVKSHHGGNKQLASVKCETENGKKGQRVLFKATVIPTEVHTCLSVGTLGHEKRTDGVLPFTAEPAICFAEMRVEKKSVCHSLMRSLAPPALLQPRRLTSLAQAYLLGQRSFLHQPEALASRQGLGERGLLVAGSAAAGGKLRV